MDQEAVSRAFGQNKPGAPAATGSVRPKPADQKLSQPATASNKEAAAN
jgi:hypothetical protein